MSTIYDWSRVNWNQRNSDIRAALGCSRQIVSYWRRKLRKPHPKNRGTYRGSAMERIARIPSDELRAMNVHELAKRLGIGLTYASTLATQLNLPVRRYTTLPQWRLINWDLPNREIARVWFGNQKNPTLAQVSRHRPHRARWDARNGGARGAAYRSALKQEQKARSQWQ